MERSHTERIIIRIVFALTALSVICTCFALVKLPLGIGRILLLCLAALPLALAIFLLYLLWLARRTAKGEHNFFLYDRHKRKNMPLEELTFQQVSDRLVSYMALFRRGKRLYLAALFDEEGGAPESFKPLFCYQLLGMLSVSEDDSQLCAFLHCGKELADALSTYLTLAGEEKMSRELQVLIAQFDGSDITPFRTYLRQNSDYLAEHMLAYTKENIRQFD